MTTDELAKTLKEFYDRAPSGEKHVHVVLFGIKVAKALSTQSVAEVTARSGIGKWGPQVSMGVKLANHVSAAA
jgi:hypothetical protein